MMPFPSRRTAWLAATFLVALLGVLDSLGIRVSPLSDLPPSSWGWATALGLCLFGLGEGTPSGWREAFWRERRQVNKVLAMSYLDLDDVNEEDTGMTDTRDQAAFAQGWNEAVATIHYDLGGED